MRRLVMLALALGGVAHAQPAPCPPAWELRAADLLGLWRGEVAGQADTTTLLLEQHPDYDGFRGALKRGGEQRIVAGDVDEGDFTLEESADGHRIAAAWSGQVVEGSCGREIRGEWQADGAQDRHAFVLRKAAPADAGAVAR